MTFIYIALLLAAGRRYASADVPQSCSRFFRRDGSAFNFSEKPPKARFVMFSASRSGSNWLVSLLQAHPKICMNGEVFMRVSNGSQGTYADHSGIAMTVSERDKDRAAFLNLVYDAPSKRCLQVGFKAFQYQLFDEEFESLVREPSIKKLVLRRRNLLAMYVSKLKAESSGEWHGQNTSNMTVEVSPSAFKKFAMLRQKYFVDCLSSIEAETNVSGPAWLHIEYEQLVAEPAATLDTILRFLELKERGAKMIQTEIVQKQDSSSLCHSIVNYNELACDLLRTGYASHLDESCGEIPCQFSLQ